MANTALFWILGLLVPLCSTWGFIWVFGVFNLFLSLSQTRAVIRTAF